MSGIKSEIAKVISEYAPKILSKSKGVLKGAAKKLGGLLVGGTAGGLLSSAFNFITGGSKEGGVRSVVADDKRVKGVDTSEKSDKNTDLDQRLLNQERNSLLSKKEAQKDLLKKQQKEFRGISITNDLLTKSRIESTESISIAKSNLDNSVLSMYNNQNPELARILELKVKKAQDDYSALINLDRDRELRIDNGNLKLSELSSSIDTLSVEVNSLESQLSANTSSLRSLIGGVGVNFKELKEYISNNFNKVKSTIGEVTKASGDGISKALGIASLALTGLSLFGGGSEESTEGSSSSDSNTDSKSKPEGSQVSGVLKGAALNAAIGVLPEIASKVAAKDGMKLVEKVGVKTAGKFIGKTALKHVPLLGVGIGAKFAYDRYQQGDYLGSALEMASGLSSTLDLVAPGAGLAAGLLIDGVLGGMDAYKEMNKFDASAYNKNSLYKDLTSGKAPTYGVNAGEGEVGGDYWKTLPKSLGDVIASGESAKSGGYNAANLGERHGYRSKDYSNDKIPLTSRSIGDILDNAVLSKKGKEFNAVGKYQMQANFIKDHLDTAGLSRKDKFSASNQEKLFKAYLFKDKNIRRYLTTKFNSESEEQRARNLAIDAISGRWAAVKNSRGSGTHDNDGINKSSVHASDIAKHLTNLKSTIFKKKKEKDDSTPEMLKLLDNVNKKLDVNNVITTETFKQALSNQPSSSNTIVYQDGFNQQNVNH